VYCWRVCARGSLLLLVLVLTMMDGMRQIKSELLCMLKSYIMGSAVCAS
jgi:hypothetical protein